MQKRLVVVGMMGATLLWAASASAASISLSATVRDFCGNGIAGCPAGFAGHADFERTVADDPGIAGPLGTALAGDGTPVYAFGAAPSPANTVSDATRFNQFYHAAAGVNQTTSTSLLFSDIGGGLFQYDNSAYFPIDGVLMGNQGNAHNYWFTTQLHTTFTYAAGQSFAFLGDDDVWVYIDKKLALDLGGVHVAKAGSINLDTLGLTAGNTYDFDFFGAERHTNESNVKITTSIVFNENTPVPEPASIFLLSTGIATGLRYRWRQKKTKP